MTDRKTRFEKIDGYIEASPIEVRPILQVVRKTIAEAVPDAVETIGYQMPAFKRRKIFIYFAAFKNHIGVYPPLKGNPDLQDALTHYRGPKGNLKFSLDQPMPVELIGRLAKALADQYSN